MRKRFLRSRSGEGYPMVIAVTLCLLMLFMLIYIVVILMQILTSMGGLFG